MTIRMTIRATLAASLLALPALAQDPAASVPATPCDDYTRADAIMEPWEANTATYANGQVRIAVLDFIEPAAAAIKLMVISPPRDEVGGRQCRIVALPDGHGFGNVDFAARSASYSAENGLVISLPVFSGPPDSGDEGWAQLYISINQTTGQVRSQFHK